MLRKSSILVLFLIFIVGGTTQAQDFKYIGASKCKMCHNKPTTGAQYSKWLEGPHAKAMESLKGDEKTDPKCIKCHATAGSVDAAQIATLKMEEGVSCESCHGPGSAYKSKTVMQDRAKSIEKGLIIPNEETCTKCHNDESPHFKGFNFEEYSQKIAHPNPAAAK